MAPRSSTKALLSGLLLAGSSLASAIPLQKRADVPTSIIPTFTTRSTAVTAAPPTTTAQANEPTTTTTYVTVTSSGAPACGANPPPSSPPVEGISATSPAGPAPTQKTTLKITVSIPDNIQPAINADFPDPAIIQGADGKWFAFGSSAWDGPRVRVATADSPLGPWSFDKTADAKADLAWTFNQYTWAPDATRLPDGSYILYYSAPRAGGGPQCLGAARAASPAGPFKPDAEPLMCRDEYGGVIDVSGFNDPVTGKRYIVYKLEGRDVQVDGTSYITPQFVREVGTDGTTFLGDEKLINWRTEEDDFLVEAPQVIYRNGHYILFFSSHVYDAETYDTKYAVADSVTGPYERRGQIIASPMGGLWGPGGAQAVSAEGVNVIVFHGWCNDRKDRCMYAAEYTVEEVPV